MITSRAEYTKVHEELELLGERLNRMQAEYPIGEKGFTKAGIHKMIARLHEELAIYEGCEEARRTDLS